MLKFIRKLLFICFIIVICIICYITFEGYSMYNNAISKLSLEENILQIKKQENYVTLDNIPKIYQNAVIAIEDHRYYEHNGIDFIATGRAFIANISDGELSQGGSTITQQLAKNLYFTQEKKFARKVAELFVAFDLENNYSKDDILELYINTIYYGKGYYGLSSACKGFFKKSPNELTNYEATYIAGIPNAPSIYSSERHSELAKKRHLQVLNAMVKYGYLSQIEANKIYNE